MIKSVSLLATSSSSLQSFAASFVCQRWTLEFFVCITCDLFLSYDPIIMLRFFPGKGKIIFPILFPHPGIIPVACLWYCSLKSLFQKTEGFTTFAVYGSLCQRIDLHEMPVTDCLLPGLPTNQKKIGYSALVPLVTCYAPIRSLKFFTSA